MRKQNAEKNNSKFIGVEGKDYYESKKNHSCFFGSIFIVRSSRLL